MITRAFVIAALCGGLSALPVGSGQAQGVRLYCDGLGGYYPYVTSCPGGWHRYPGYYGAPVPGVVYPPGAYAPEVYAPAAPYPPGAYPTPAPPNGYPTVAPGYPPPPPPGASAPPPSQPGAHANLPPPARERTEEEHAANLESAAEIGMRREQDQADGFRETTLANAASKFRSIGGGFILTGYYSLAEDHALLSDKVEEAESHIFVVPDKLSKAGRAMLADCDDCRITIWAHKGCSKSALGDQSGAPCLVLERVKKGSYAANTTIYR